MALSNLLIINNVVRNVTDGVSLKGDVNTNVDIVNNSFYDGTNAVIISVELVSGKIVNNALNGNSSAGTGISVGTVTTSTIDYNVVYDYNTAYGGNAAAGGNSFTTDPLFVSSTDLRVGPGSPCIDSGAGSGTYSEVPADDIRGQARPVDIDGYADVTNGTDIGAYEMLQGELVATTYYVNASGTGVAPYNSVSTGAVNFKQLTDNVTPSIGDIIEVVDDGEIDDSANTIAFTVSVIIRSYSGNANKPTIKVHNTSQGFTFQAASGIKVQNLKIKKDGPSATNAMLFFDTGSFTDTEVTGNELWVVDETSVNVNALLSNGDQTGSVFSNNTIYDVTSGMFISGDMINMTVESNTIYNIGSYGLHSSSTDVTSTTISKNIIYNGTRGLFFSGVNLTNPSIKNNVIRDMSHIGFLIAASGTMDGVDVVNNTIRNAANTQIYFDGSNPVVNSKVINNMVDGAGAPQGILLDGDGSNTLDYNNVYGATDAFVESGGVSVGSNNTYYYPYFVSTTNLMLQSNSPGVDAGAGSGTHAEVPSDDIRGQSRPVDITGYPNADNGTDIGAYEMLAAEAPLVNKSYFIDAGGSDTIPYDSLAKAATSFYELFNKSTGGNTGPSMKIFTTDFVEVSSLGGEISDTMPSGSNKITACTIRSYSGNTDRPIVNIPASCSLGIFGSDLNLYNIDFIRDGSGGAATNQLIGPYPATSVNSFEMKGCSYRITNATGVTGVAAIAFTGSDTITSFKVKNNLIKNLNAQALQIDWAAPNAEIINNTFDCFFDAGAASAAVFITNTADQSAGMVFANNIIFNRADTGTAIRIDGVNLPDQNYNCINGFTDEYGGVATQGTYNIHLDPEFADYANNDFMLSADSPCLEAGAGTGVYNGRPSTDIRGVARPQDLSWPSVDDGTDIGAYEMLAEEVDAESDSPFNVVQGGGSYTVFPGSGFRGKIVIRWITAANKIFVRAKQEIGR